MKTFLVTGSHGEIEVDAKTGRVVKADVCDCDDCREYGDYRNIRKVNVKEWCRHYGQHEPDSHVDILDVGYWYATGGELAYEAPVDDWREEFRSETA